MQTKLTLRLDSELIAQAKDYAQEQGKSLSQVVADYFALFGRQQPSEQDAPMTASLRGIMKGKSVDEQDYKQHLEDKYL